MLIKEVRAFETTLPYLPAAAGTPPPRRPSWIRDTEIANPVSRYPKYKGRRASWLAPWPMAGCLVTADDGTWGLGLASRGRPVVSVINDHLGPLLAGEPCMATERLWDLMVRCVSPYGPAGLASYAISAVDLALWDLKGKLLRQPVYALLGGPARDHQVCYATGNDTDWHLELGFRGTKLSCPYGPVDGEAGLVKMEDLVARTRTLIGDEVELMLDCWMGFDLEYAVRAAERLRPHRLRWIEDCLDPEDLDGFARLRRRIPWMGLATGEHWYVTHPFAFAAARRAVDVLQPDVHWAGGVTACVKITHLAEAAGITVSPHAGMNTPYGQHVCFAMPNVLLGEYSVESAPGVPLAETVRLPGTPVPRDGVLVPSDAPGFGLEIDLDWIEQISR